jgi:hypothetical protein
MSGPMSTRVNLAELCDALLWVGSGEAVGMDCGAYVNRATGAIHWSGGDFDEELPDDIDDESRYVAVPDKRGFDLGRPLVFRFVAENIPDSYERVSQYFRKQRACARFKDELERTG